MIDLPGFSYDLDQHERERVLLKAFFDADYKEEKDGVRKEYNNHAFEHHRKIKEQFRNALEEDHDFILAYFSVADVVGHLNFGNNLLMKMVYKELDDIAKEVSDTTIVLSDHGMKAIGTFGDHSSYGFWSTNFKDLGEPNIREFSELVKLY